MKNNNISFDIENSKIAIIGLGYVGLPLAVEFSKKYQTIGFDIDDNRINELKEGYDRTSEISKNVLKSLNNLDLTNKESSLSSCNVFCITVPTPVDKSNSPDLSSLASATKIVGRNLQNGDIVIYESTVYPGATEEFCVPILEKESKLIYNNNFFCGYSPERINPGDNIHNLTSIIKITSGSNKKAADFVDGLYKSIIPAGTHLVSSIIVAESAKIIENVQRDVNIALINELSLIFNKMKLNTSEILKAARTKWNFLDFRPGLVGGHCIGVDPYYLTYKASKIGFHPEIILAGRKVNDSMSRFISQSLINKMIKSNIDPNSAKVAVLGITFKENCPDLRNSKVIDIINDLRNYGCNTIITDEYANVSEAKKVFNINLKSLREIRNVDAIILSVSHDQYKSMKLEEWEKIIKPNGIFIDVKSILPSDIFAKTKVNYWSL